MSRYKVFEQLKELTKLTKIHNGYAKMIQTGDLQICDYGIGFIDVSIYYIKNQDNEHYIRLWFGTIDDGDFGAWKLITTKEKAQELIEKIANEVFKDMVKLPTQESLNTSLRKYGMYVCNE